MARFRDQRLKPYVFRVIREKVAGETVRVLLEPYTDDQVASLSDGDEFITGALAVDPWDETKLEPE